jgi:hypothetical protein
MCPLSSAADAVVGTKKLRLKQAHSNNVLVNILRIGYL